MSARMVGARFDLKVISPIVGLILIFVVPYLPWLDGQVARMGVTFSIAQGPPSGQYDAKPHNALKRTL